MSYKFADTDSLVETESGKTISKIFKEEGEEHFRQLEKKILHSTARMNDVVIATGGGLACYNDNMQWMNENGVTVYLEANVGVLFHRLASSKKGRPLIEDLNDIELMERITRDLTYRSHFYSMARVKVNALNLKVNQLRQKLEKLK